MHTAKAKLGAGKYSDGMSAILYGTLADTGMQTDPWMGIPFSDHWSCSRVLMALWLCHCLGHVRRRCRRAQCRRLEFEEECIVDRASIAGCPLLWANYLVPRIDHGNQDTPIWSDSTTYGLVRTLRLPVPVYNCGIHAGGSLRKAFESSQQSRPTIGFYR